VIEMTFIMMRSPRSLHASKFIRKAVITGLLKRTTVPMITAARTFSRIHHSKEFTQIAGWTCGMAACAEKKNRRSVAPPVGEARTIDIF